MSQDYSPKQIEIMEHALDLFAENGFENTSVRDIATVADINVAMVSYYFGSKQKLLEAIFIHNTESVRNQLGKIVKASDSNPEEKIDRIIDVYIDAFIEHPKFFLLLSREQIRTRNNFLYNAIRELKQRNGSLLRAAIKTGEKAGYFRKNIDIPMLAQTLFGTVSQTFSNRRHLCEIYNIKEHTDASFADFIFPKLRAHLKTLFKLYLTNK